MFRLLAESVLDYAIFIVSPDGRVLSWNRGAERLLGFTAAEIVGRACDLFFTPEDVTAGVPRRELNEALATGRGDGDRWHVRKDGTRFWSSGTVTPLRDEGGRLCGFAKVMRDRTDLKRAEDELASNQKRLQALFDTTLDAVLLADDRGRYVDANPAACTLLGYDRGELLRLGVSDVTPAPHADARRIAWDAFLRDGRREGEYTIRRKDGTTAVVEFRAVANVQPGLHLSVLRDVTERGRVQAALERSEARLAAVFDALPVGVGVTDAAGAVVLSNREMLRYLPTGVMPSRDDDRHRRWHARRPDGSPVDRADFPGARALRGERVVPGVEMRYTHDDGAEVWAQVAAVPIRDGDGRVAGQVAVVTDVDALKRAEQALRASEARLAEAQRIAGVGSWEIDWPTQHVWWSAETYRLLGFEPGAYEPTVEGFLALVPAEDRPAVQSAIAAALAGEAEYRVDHRIVRADGAVRWVSEQAEVAFGPGGEPVRVAGTVLDITDRKRAEDALRESEERFARFMGHLPGLAWLKDDRGRYVYANDAAARAFGRPAADLYGRTDAEVFPPDTAAQFRENDRAALATAGGVRAVETLKHPDGTLRHSLVSKFPVPSRDGEPPLVGGVAVDITEEVRTRAVLEESEERFRATFDQAAVGIAHVGTDGHWLRVNRKLCEIVGYDPDELRGLTFQDITHPDDVGADLAQLRRLVAGEIATYAMEKRYFRKDGRTVWVNLTVALVRTPSGGPKYLISVVEDVTAKRAVEDALRESEGRLRTLSDNLPHGAIYQVVADPHGGRRFTFVSAGVERLFGVTAAEATADATALCGLIHADDRGRVAAAEEAALRDLSPYDCEFRSHTRGGQVRWFHCRSAPRRLPAGEVVWEGVITDVTARKLAEEELRRRVEEVETLMEFVPIAVIRADDPACHRLTGNPAAHRLLGVPPGSHLSKTPPPGQSPPAYRTLQNGREVPPADLPMQVACRTGREVRDAEYEIAFAGGESRHIYCYATPLFDGAGRVQGCLFAALDITDRKNAEDELREQDRRKNEFLATLAHELRNPLAPIRNGLQVLRLARGDAATAERAMGMMDRQLTQMVHLIDDLLDVSRITRGKLHLRRERVDLAAVVRNAVEASRPLVEAAAHRLAVALPPEPVYLDADPTRLAQVLSNLLTNAAKYTERGGDIRLAARREGGDVVVSVRDTGIGIAPEHLPRLFEMFSQVDSALERSQGGLGIGLALVKGLTEAHGGRVRVDSAEGAGTTFKVDLPLRPADAASARTLESPTVPGR